VSEAAECIRATTLVAADPATAFSLFTEEVDSWWRRGPRFRHGGDRPSAIRFEGGEGGRLLEVYTDAEGGAFEIGRILAWKPADRLVFEFRAKSFEPGLVTEVEVRFEREGSATRVTLEHRGWDRVPLDHAVRHGTGASQAFVGMMGLFWGDLLASLRTRATDDGARPRPHERSTR
jgi:uncharacterized protein YndB with AHSA1/START domain